MARQSSFTVVALLLNQFERIYFDLVVTSRAPTESLVRGAVIAQHNFLKFSLLDKLLTIKGFTYALDALSSPWCAIFAVTYGRTTSSEAATPTHLIKYNTTNLTGRKGFWVGWW